MSNKAVARNFNVAKNILSTWKKNKENIIAGFKSSEGTKKQRINKVAAHTKVGEYSNKWPHNERKSS